MELWDRHTLHFSWTVTCGILLLVQTQNGGRACHFKALDLTHLKYTQTQTHSAVQLNIHGSAPRLTA